MRPHTRRIENALTALHQIDYVLEVGMAEDIELHTPLDIGLMRNLAWTVQEQAKDLSHELSNLPTRYNTQTQVQAAAGYANAAADAYRAFLQRIDTTTARLRTRDRNQDAEIIELVTTMLADPRVQHLRNPHPPST